MNFNIPRNFGVNPVTDRKTLYIEATRISVRKRLRYTHAVHVYKYACKLSLYINFFEAAAFIYFLSLFIAI